ncbi:sialidase family protein [Brachyspira sp. SAP_772]|uniref:sialidase family protein n=1 Tax=Brachyspira sp. SAP_772 TaxID=2608385 RepID=UPI0012F4D7B7|nr:sialidase family protein [Brachyspira sp. SAP_772]
MSKKIIYLLSLVVVLSLLFASCKKDNGFSPIKDKNENSEDEIKNNTGGVIDNWEGLEEYAEKPIQDYAVIDVSKSGSDYYRNPVVVALGGSNVLIITEKRIGFKGSENDVGVDGKNRTDIVYLLSSNAGDSFASAQTVGSASTSGSDAVCSPIVYYKKPSSGTTAKIYIIASSGAGLSRTDTAYTDRDIKSKLKYIVGTVSGIDGKATVSWDAGWQDLSWTDSGSAQYGTHSARGVMGDDGSLILPVIFTEANTGGLGTISDPKERLMMNIFKIDNNNFSIVNNNSFGLSSFTPLAADTNFNSYKAASVISYSSTERTIDYLCVPTEEPMKIMKWVHRDDQNSDNYWSITGGYVTLLSSGDGSFGFLKIDNGWYGTNEYDPSVYASNPANAGSSVDSKSLLSHALPMNNGGKGYLIFYYLDIHQAGGGIVQAKTSKSSSIDILPDGTIIMATEKERDPNADGNKFSIFFSRYTQKYISK